MTIQQLFTSRKKYDASTYVAPKGKLFYDEEFGVLKISDGVTVGGNTIPFTIADSVTVGGIKSGPSFTISNTGTLSLNAATPTVIGGIKIGPGVTLNGNDQLIIDTAGLDFSFGDFYAFTHTGPSNGACLSSINVNQDVNLVSNGEGSVNVVGEFNVRKTDGDLESELSSPPVFSVDSNGIAVFRVPVVDVTNGAVSIIGTLSGSEQAPVNSGVMLHITGNNDIPSRLYVDGVGGYAGFVGRQYNGTSSAPTAVNAGDEVMRLAANAYNSSGWSGVGSSNIRFISTDNQTSTAQGMKIDFYSTPQGSSTSAISKVMSVEGGVGVTATNFVGPLQGNATTATTATNLAAATGILTGTLTVDPIEIPRLSASVQTFTLLGLTTNHKIVITAGNALGVGLVITAAWASAANTLSLEIQNFLGNTDLNPAAKTLQYFAWI